MATWWIGREVRRWIANPDRPVQIRYPLLKAICSHSLVVKAMLSESINVSSILIGCTGVAKAIRSVKSEVIT